MTPQAEHTWLVGSNRPILRKSRPYSRALYSSIAVNADQPASYTDLASRVRASPRTARSSTVTAWFSRMIFVDSLCWKSRRASATLACARATLTRALSLLRLPCCLRDRSRCARVSFFSTAQEPGSGDLRPVVQHRKMTKSEVDPALSIRPRQRRRGDLDHERGEEPARRIPDHRH